MYIVAGPNRPIPPPDHVQTSEDTTTNYGPGVMNTIENARSGVYSRLNDALAERGCVHDCPTTSMSVLNESQREMLGNIEQQIGSLQQGSKDMVAQVNIRLLAV
jgi:syntaxin-binding protein 5